MNITISAKDFKLTPAIKEYVNEKMGKLTRYSKRIQRIGVELDVDHSAKSGLINRIEVWIYFPEKTLSAGVKAEHMNEAIDLVYPKIERQITKYEGKLRDQVRPSRI
jgi:putative sigma-54 modulation protein